MKLIYALLLIALFGCDKSKDGYANPPVATQSDTVTYRVSERYYDYATADSVYMDVVFSTRDQGWVEIMVSRRYTQDGFFQVKNLQRWVRPEGAAGWNAFGEPWSSENFRSLYSYDIRIPHGTSADNKTPGSTNVETR